jgi:hypothetical protein
MLSETKHLVFQARTNETLRFAQGDNAPDCVPVMTYKDDLI